MTKRFYTMSCGCEFIWIDETWFVRNPVCKLWDYKDLSVHHPLPFGEIKQKVPSG